jgi:hypothetical protein
MAGTENIIVPWPVPCPSPAVVQLTSVISPATFLLLQEFGYKRIAFQPPVEQPEMNL